MKQTLTILSLLLLGGFSLSAHEPTRVAPAFFGPNAFPIPELVNGQTSNKIEARLAGEYYFGSMPTGGLYAFTRLPLFTDRANLTLWLPVQEWYKGGHGTGDVYVTTEIMVCRERRYLPSMTLRAALKTASGEQSSLRRHYDCPGYWFDFSAGKSFHFSPESYLRLSGTIGFLCWQTSTTTQNDAPYYGIQLEYLQRYLNLSACWKGYTGWERCGDAPMAVGVKLGVPIKSKSGIWQPYAQCDYGLRDYPYTLLRVGLEYSIALKTLSR